MRTSMLALVALGLFLSAAPPLQAVEVDLSGEVEAKCVSAFLWRGRIPNDEPCFQPNLMLATDHVYLRVLGNWNLTDVSNSWASTRVDTTLGYQFPLEKHLLRAGFTAYIYHDDPGHRATDTHEWFMDFTLNTLFLPSLQVYYDSGEMDGFYAAASVAHSFPLVKDKASLDLKLFVSAADKKVANATFSFPADAASGRDAFEPDRLSLVDMTAVASIPIPLGKQVTLTPAVKYMTLLDSRIRDAVDDAGESSSEFVYSLALAAAF